MRIRRQLGLGTVLTLALAGAGFAATAGEVAIADAAMNQDYATVRTLIEQKADVNAAQADGSTALLWAAHWGDLENVEFLLASGADATAANRYGVTPLAEASASGNAAVIAKLLDAGADPNAPFREGETPLMNAARTGNLEAVKTLIDHGADVNSREGWRGQTALMWAAAEEHPEVVRLLIAKNANINGISEVFDYSKMRPKIGSVPMNWPRGGFAPLLFAARQGSVESAKALVEAGADVNLADPDGVTPLTMAILNFHFDLAAYLIEKGADVNYSDTKGRTALYTAVDMHRLNISTRPNPVVTDKLAAGDIVRMLLERGASPNAQLTAMIPARGVLDIGDFVLGAGTTPFLRAAKGSDLELMRLLVEHGADPRIATRGGMTPLMAAAGVGWMDGKTRGTPEESMEAVQFCLDRGLDINAATGLGETALHGAAGRGNNAIIKFLAELGADPLAKDKRGLTPRDIALGKGGGIGGVRAPDPETLALLESLEEARKSSDLVAKREQ